MQIYNECKFMLIYSFFYRIPHIANFDSTHFIYSVGGKKGKEPDAIFALWLFTRRLRQRERLQS